MRTIRGTKQDSKGFHVILSALGILFLLLTSASVSLAQQTAGRIFGTVLDTQGASIPNAQVTITNQDTGVARVVVSGSDGFYNAPEVLPGKYTVATSVTGFEAIQEKDIEVTVASERRVDLKLTIGSVQQTVVVTGGVALVDTSSSAVGSTVTEEKVADLPLNGRNWISLTILQPGVTQSNLYAGNAVLPGANGTIYSSNGGSLRSNFYSLDGANMSTLVGYNSSSMTNSSLGIDGIKEYKVVTSMFSAEYGLRSGSQTVIVSKGGGNEFHGDAFDYLRNSSLDARNYFDGLDTADVNGCGTDKSLVYPCKRIPPYRRNNFGGSFGGPIKKDKTFFYAVYEGIRQKQGQTITTETLPAACFVGGVVPAVIANNGCVSGSAATPINVNSYILPLARLFPAPNTTGYPTFNYTFPYVQPASENYGQIRLDQNFTMKDTFFVRYTADYANQTTPQVTGAYPGYYMTEPSYSHFVTFAENHTFSPTVLNTARLSYSRTYENVNNEVVPASLNAPNVLLVPGTYVGNISPGSGVTALGTLCCPTSAAQDIWTLSDDIYWTKGKHSLQFGTSLNEFLMYPNAHNFFQGTVAFANLSSFFNAIYSTITVEKPGSQTAFSLRMQTYGFYVQDNYRVSSRVTLNLGLRYEPGTVPEDRNPARRYTIQDPLTATMGAPGPLWKNNTWDKFSPRLGFAWDVTGRGTTSIKGGAGIYYDLGSFTSIPLVQGISNPPVSENLQILNTSQTPNPAFTVPLTISGSLPLSPREPQYNLNEPLVMQYNLTVQQELPWQTAITVSYVGSQGQHLFQVRNANYVKPVGEVDGLPEDGCWNAAQTAYMLPGATGACPTGFTSIGPRANPNFGVFQLNQSEGRSYYNSLQVNLNKRISQGVQFQVAYTYAKLLDTGQGEFSSESPTELTQFNNLVPQSFDRGPASFDVRHNLRVNTIYRLPVFKVNKFVGGFANGWWFSGIVSAQSGFPITPQLGSDRALAGDTYAFLRPDIGPTFNASTVVTGNPNQWFNPTMFSLPVAGTYGDAGRGILRGPGLFDTDFSAVKETKAPFLGEAGSIEFRAEVFNLFNNVNFALPVATVWSSGTPGTVSAGPIGSAGITPFATAGHISSTVSNSRQIQLALKVIF